jgi:isoleucyl-tRNA synthetase
VLAGSFVSKDAGTGIVHLAPGFGDDDYKVCVKNGIINPEYLLLFLTINFSNPLIPLDANGRFLSTVT